MRRKFHVKQPAVSAEEIVFGALASRIRSASGDLE